MKSNASDQSIEDEPEVTFVDYVRRYRPGLRQVSDGVWVHNPMMMFVSLAFFFQDPEFYGMHEFAEDTGWDYMREQDVEWLQLLDRLETMAIGIAGNRMMLGEVMTIEWSNWPDEHDETSLCIAEIGDLALFGVYESLSTPKFWSCGFGGRQKVLQAIGQNPEIALQPVANYEGATILRVVVRSDVPWTLDTLQRVANAMMGNEASRHEVVNLCRLIGSS